MVPHFAARLFALARSGSTDELRYELTSCVTDVATWMFDPHTGDTLLHAAVTGDTTDHEATVELLLSLAPDLTKVRNAMGRTPALEAVMMENFNVATKLIEADVPTAWMIDFFRYSPLRSDARIALRLLDSVPNIFDYATEEGWTVLHQASRDGLVDVVKRVLDVRPALAARRTATGLLPIHLAAHAGHSAVSEMLASAHPEGLVTTDDQGKTPLYLAAEYAPWKEPSIIQTLFDACPEAALIRRDDGKTVLHEIARLGTAADAAAILSRYPELALVTDAKGFSPLHCSVSTQFYRWSRLSGVIIDANPKCIHVKSKDGRTAMDVLLQEIRNATFAFTVFDTEEFGAFFSKILKHHPLPEAAWRVMPMPCIDISSALGPALDRSEDEAARIVKHMTSRDIKKLRTALLTLASVQNKLGIRVNFLSRCVAAALFE